MSARREHRRRYNQKLAYIAKFTQWIESEPPMFLFWKWKNGAVRGPKWRLEHES